MKIFFDYSDSLVTSEMIVDDFRHNTPLLSYCDGNYPNNGHTREGLSYLLRRGADVHARNRQGETCLHLHLAGIASHFNFHCSRAPNIGPYLERVRESLTYLIENDADVRAVNYYGESVSDVAYEDIVRGLVWDAVLADCGFKVADFRTEEHEFCWHPSLITCSEQRYTLGECFTTEVFAALWKGREHLCPYYEEAIRCGFNLDEDGLNDADDSVSSDGSSDSEDGGCMLYGA